MRRVAFAVPVLLASSLFLSACASGSAEAGIEADAKPTATTSSGSKSLDLKLPKKADYLVPETTGSGTKRIAPFLSKKDVYTVHVRCGGKGVLSLRDGSKDPVRVTCGGSVAIGHIFIEKGAEQKLTVSPDSEKTAWAIAILEGKQKLTP
ncbi:hypothetical protein ABT160_41235 [Streptomyces sp. NPDC001941]|uniref:hypothetical protein n=1 Tax=Streptomyces sp. NPDC001941 TaxID=3154659 RepID=UPI0033235C59